MKIDRKCDITGFCASSSDARLGLEHVQFGPYEGRYVAVATNGVVMGVIDLPAGGCHDSAPDDPFLVPKEALQKAWKIAAKDVLLDIKPDKSKPVVDCGEGVQIHAEVDEEARFPQSWEQVVPSGPPKVALGFTSGYLKQVADWICKHVGKDAAVLLEARDSSGACVVTVNLGAGSDDRLAKFLVVMRHIDPDQGLGNTERAPYFAP